MKFRGSLVDAGIRLNCYSLFDRWIEYDSRMLGIYKRLGDKPQTSTNGPHSHLIQRSSHLIWETLVERSLAIPHVVQGVSAVSPRASIALLYDDLIDIANPMTSLSPKPPLEPIHIHGPHDNFDPPLPSTRTGFRGLRTQLG